MAVKVTLDDKKMRRFIRKMPKASARSQSRALNKAITRSRTQAARAVSKKRNILVGAARGAMKLYRASPGKAEASIVARGEPISLMDVKGVKRQTKKGVTVKLEVGSKPHLFEGAFIARMESGHVGVFQRRKSNPKKIREIKLPSVAATMIQPELERLLTQFAAPIYEAELQRLLKLAMEKAGAR